MPKNAANAARAPFAASDARSKGRLVPEPVSPTRTAFQRDRDRIVHATAFRRLAHKTQVFIPFEGDHFRTRLTHTIEVAQIARALARGLALDDDLAEALALAHDLGHTPFGHTGEDVLDELMRPYGGFDHNAQALRIVTRLERRYAEFDGLNLTFETLEGLVKHNGPLTGPYRVKDQPVPLPIIEFDALFSLNLSSQAGAEAQAAAIADDIAYNAHDIDDGLRAGLFTLDQLAAASPFVAGLLAQVRGLYPGLEQTRLINEIVRRVITLFVEDVLAESKPRLAALAPRTIADVRAAAAPVVAFSPAMALAERSIKAFLFQTMYRHPDVMRVREKAAMVVASLFPRLLAEPALLPPEWAAKAIRARDETARARLVSDYIAGMTDRYALAEYRRLFDAQVDLR